ncbi:MAG TPA: xanthine dehydrogenase family protein molybdopterin-binding subunit [Stellaceae bacterium]|nr:xanthine dehydrogenase family protein molybdopterin-binding subunit [Stellaceae bacterium]
MRAKSDEIQIEESWIGQSVPRFEDDRLLTGNGRFVDDFSPEGCLHLEFLRSPHARGTIGSIDLSTALASPGVIAAFTATDLGDLGQAMVNPLISGIRAPRFTLLADGAVEAVGQPIAVVVADTPLHARDAIEQILFDFEPVPLRSGDAEDEAAAHSWSRGDVDGAFADADRIIPMRVEHSRVAPTPLEPRATLAIWNATDTSLTVWTGTQSPHRTRADLATILGLPTEQVRVVAPDVGGAFGGKASLYPEDAMVAWAARRLGRPIKWCATRGEDLQAATHGRGGVMEGELAISNTGRMLGLRARLVFPLGYWMPFSAVVPGRNAARILPGPYRVDHLDITLSARLSNTAPMGIYRGAGRPEAAMLMDRLIDKAARVLDLDPVEFRRRNLIEAAALPYRTPTGETLDSGNYPALLEAACQRADYPGLRQRQALRRRKGEIQGIGVSLYIEPCGTGWESATVGLARDGKIVAATGSTAQGQGRETAFAQIAADVLGIPMEKIRLKHGDTKETPNGIGALASRSTAIGGSALMRAAQAFHDAARQAAADMLGLPAQRLIATQDGFVAPHDSGRMATWQALAHRHGDAARDGEALVSSVVFHADGEAWSCGCCIAVVSVDPETGVPTIEQVTWVDDIGVVVNPMLVHGQMMGGMAQGIGEALLESIVYDADGQLLTGSLMDYAMPRASDMPPVNIGRMESPSPVNALGAKGVGEAGCIGVPAAIVNAVVDALSPFGVTHIDMPMTSEKIWKAMQAATRPTGETVP